MVELLKSESVMETKPFLLYGENDWEWAFHQGNSGVVIQTGKSHITSMLLLRWHYMMMELRTCTSWNATNELTLVSGDPIGAELFNDSSNRQQAHQLCSYPVSINKARSSEPLFLQFIQNADEQCIAFCSGDIFFDTGLLWLNAYRLKYKICKLYDCCIPTGTSSRVCDLTQK